MAIDRVNLEDVINDAKAALEAGNPDKAIALCHHIFKFYPRCLEASRMLGEAYTEQRHFDEAEQLFTFVLSADPQDVLGYVDRGFIAYEQGRLDDAILYCERALELDPSIEQLREELLRLYRERTPGVRAQIRMTKVGLANGRLRDGLYGQAIEEYNNVLRQTPHRLDVQVGLMEAYWRNRDYNRAEQLAQELIENNQYLVKANLILWHIYGVRRNQDRAAEYVERAHALDPLNLLAERLFEDPAASSEAMNYISMLGIPAIPRPDSDSLAAEAAGQQKLVPDWATNRQETDVVLGLKPELPPAAATAENSNLGLDLFALLSDTERHVAQQQEEETVLPAETSAPEQPTALTDLGQQSSSREDDPFSLFEEVESPAEPVVPLPAAEPARPAPGAFDLDFSLGKEGDLSLFEEVDHAEQAQPTPEPFSFEPELAAEAAAPAEEKTEKPAELVPFDFDEDAEPPEFLRDIPPFDFGEETAASNRSAQEQPSELAESSSEASAVLPSLEPFNLDEVLNSAVEEVPTPGPARTIQPAFKSEEFEAAEAGLEPFSFSDEAAESPTSSNDSFEPVTPDEGPALPLEPEVEPHPTPIPTPSVVPSESPDAPHEEPGATPAAEPTPPGLPEIEPGADRGEPLPMFETDAAFEPVNAAQESHDEPGMFAGFAANDESTQEPTAAFEVYREPYAFYKRDEQGPVPDFALEQMAQESSVAAFSGLDDLEPATEAPLTTSPNELQENPEMPIKRGMENDNDLFDWEREELPDYLKAFALDEDEIEQAGLSAESPSITDVNTPPARIRSREDTGPTNLGDLPPWLLPEEPAAPPPPQNDLDDTGSIDRLGLMTSALPSWLDIPASDSEDDQTPAQADQGGFETSDFDNLAPFNLDDDSDFGTPPAQAASQAPAPFTPADDLEPFSLDDEVTGFEPPAAPAQARTANVPPPPPAPAFDLGLDDDDLQPFSFDDFDAALPAPPPPPPAPIQARESTPPPVFSGQDDFGDLLPFDLEDEGDMPLPPPPPPPPPAVNRQPSFADQFRPGLEDDGLDAIQPFSIDDFDLPAAPPPAATGPLVPPAPAKNDFDLEPFSWHNEADNIFGDLEPDAHDPFAALNQTAYTPPAPQPEAADTDEEKPLRQFEWVRQRTAEPEKAAAPEGMSLFERLAARRKQQEATQPIQPATRPESTGPVEVTEEDLLPLEELEARAAQSASASEATAAPAAEIAPEPDFEPVQEAAALTEPAVVAPEPEPVEAASEAETEPAEAAPEQLESAEAAPATIEDELVTPEATTVPEAAEESAITAEPATETESEEAAEPVETFAPAEETEAAQPVVEPETVEEPAQAEEAAAEFYDLPPLWFDEPEPEPEAATLDPEREGVTEPLSSGEESAAEAAEEAAAPATSDEETAAEEAAAPVEEIAAEEAATPAEETPSEEVAAEEQVPAQEAAAEEEAPTQEALSEETPAEEVFEPEPAEIAPEPQPEPVEAAFEAAPAEFEAEPEQAQPVPADEAPTELEAAEESAAPVEAAPTTVSEPEPEAAVEAQPEEAAPTETASEAEPAEAAQAEAAPETAEETQDETAPEEAAVESLAQAETEPSAEAEPAVEAAPVTEAPTEPEAVPVEQPEAAVEVAPTAAPTSEAAVEAAPTAEPASEPAVEVVAAPPAPRSPLEENLYRANQLYAQQDYNQSFTYFNQAVKTADKAELPEIVARLKEITGSAGVNARFHRVLGDAYKKQGQFQAALAEYSKALGPTAGKK